MFSSYFLLLHFVSLICPIFLPRLFYRGRGSEKEREKYDRLSVREEAENTTTLAKKEPSTQDVFPHKRKKDIKKCYSGNRCKPGYYFRALNPFLLLRVIVGKDGWLVGDQTVIGGAPFWMWRLRWVWVWRDIMAPSLSLG